MPDATCRRVTILLAALLALRGALGIRAGEEYPVDRENCDSSNIACTIGQDASGEDMSESVNPLGFLDFSVRTMDYTPMVLGELGIVSPEIIVEELPDDYEIDFTGGYSTPLQKYSRPSSYLDDESRTAFVGNEATVYVNDGEFVPANISVLTGTTIRWVINTFETVRVFSTDNVGGTPIDSGPINRNWMPVY